MKDLKTPTIRLFGSSYKNGQETCEFVAGNVIGFSEFEPRAYYSVAKNGNISSLRPRPVAIEKLPDNLPEPKPEKTKSQDAMGMHIDAMEFKDFKLAILNQHGSTPLETFAQITPAKAGQYLAQKLKNNKEGSMIRAKEVTTVASSWELVSLPETASKKVPGLVIVDIATIDNQNAYVFVCDNASLFAISESGDVYHFEPSDGDIGKMPKSAKVPHILKDNEVSKLQDDKRYANFNGNDYASITSGDNYSVLKLSCGVEGSLTGSTGNNISVLGSNEGCALTGLYVLEFNDLQNVALAVIKSNTVLKIAGYYHRLVPPIESQICADYKPAT